MTWRRGWEPTLLPLKIASKSLSEQEACTPDLHRDLLQESQQELCGCYCHCSKPGQSLSQAFLPNDQSKLKCSSFFLCVRTVFRGAVRIRADVDQDIY